MLQWLKRGSKKLVFQIYTHQNLLPPLLPLKTKKDTLN